MKKFRLFLLIAALMVFAAGCARKDNPQGNADYYADSLFDNSRVHTIEISMSEEDRADQLASPKEKTRYKANVVVDGEEIKDVAFHTKGNSSLFYVADAGKDKFSYGISFGKYVEGQTYRGLDKLNLQNNAGDASSIKEYMAYWLFGKTGTDAPLASYAWLTVNGEDQGLFTLLEGVEDSFLDRTAEGKGTMYKPEDGALALNDEQMEKINEGGSAAHDNGGGAALIYKDDREESYPDIFENAETDDDAQTRARVIRALKALSERKDLEQYLETEEIIRYFAVHNFLVAYDSYTGSMLHNYILYENDGRLAMLPWDYDSAFGRFPAEASVNAVQDSTVVVNTGIDSPLGGIAEEERPMWNWIVSDEKYLNEYHEALSEVVSVIDSGEFTKEADRMYEFIRPYMEKDPKAFYTADRTRKAYETVLGFTEMRTESIKRQLNGNLATRSEMQEKENQVDASEITLQDMGSMHEVLESSK